MVYLYTCGAGPLTLWLFSTKWFVCPHGKHLWLSLQHQSTAKYSNLQLQRNKHPTNGPPQKGVKDEEKDVENMRFAKENMPRRKGFSRKPEREHANCGLFSYQTDVLSSYHLLWFILPLFVGVSEESPSRSLRCHSGTNNERFFCLSERPRVRRGYRQQQRRAGVHESRLWNVANDVFN